MDRQDFWEQMKLKYEEKNRTLQQKEQELRLKLEAMDAILGNAAQKAVCPALTVNKQQSIGKPSAISKPSSLGKSAVIAEIQNEEIKTQNEEIKSQNEEIIRHLSNSIFDNPNFKTCSCSQPQEKTGFFNCFFSLFGSSKGKSTPPSDAANAPPPATPQISSPPAPQDAPTKDEKPPIFSNDNCLCDPCEGDTIGGQGQFNVPTNPSKISNGSGKGDICNCSICSRINIPSSGKNISTCPCSLGAKIDDISCTCSLAGSFFPPPNNISALRKTDDQECKTEEVQPKGVKTEAPQPRVNNVFLSSSKLSLKSMDLNYMQNVHDLATQQKNLIKEINDLEQKTKIYESVFSEYKNVDFSGRDQCTCRNCKCTCGDTSTLQDPDQKTAAELKLENFLLKNELKDMRLEVRQYLERMEGPMQFKVESERYKCLQLEKKLEDANKEFVKMQELWQQEMNSLKLQLCSATTNVYNLNTMNQQLSEELQQFKKKCAKLEDDLIRQKVSEAETIKSLQAALNAQNNANVVKDECDLHQIARELSKILKECEPCGDCMNLPEDLTTAAKLLKNLTDMVDLKINKPEEDIDIYRGGDMVDFKVNKPAEQQDLYKSGDTGVLEITAVQEITEVGGSPIDQKISKASSGKQTQSISYQLAVTDEQQQGGSTIDQKISKASTGKQSISYQQGANENQQQDIVGSIVEQRMSKASSGKQSQSINQQAGTEDQQDVGGSIVQQRMSKASSGKQSQSINQQAVTEDQQDVGGSIVQQRMSKASSGRQSQSIPYQQSVTEDRQQDMPQPEEQLSAKPDTRSIGSKSASVRISNAPENDQSSKLERQSITPGNETSSKKSRETSGQEDRQSGKNTIEASEVERSIKESVTFGDSPSIQPTEPLSSQPVSRPRKISCQCVKPRKEVDQLWPKTDVPVVLKDSDVIDTELAKPKKQKCDCSISKRLREISKQQKKLDEQLAAVSPTVAADARPSISSKKSCECSRKTSAKTDVIQPTTVARSDAVDQLRSKDSERLKLSHQVTATGNQLVKSETSVKCLKTPENFPFDVDTQVDIIDKTPDGVHVTTTITDSGTLEVITEGPEGVIETTLVYTKSGNVEVVTEVLEFQSGAKSCRRGKGKIPAIESCKLDGLEGPQPVKTTTSEPSQSPEGISGAQVESTKSGPSMINPNCMCNECPALAVASKTTGPVGEAGEVVVGAVEPAAEAAEPAAQEDKASAIAEAAEPSAQEDKASAVAADTTEPQADQASSPGDASSEAEKVASKTADETASEKVADTAVQEESRQAEPSEVIQTVSLSMHVESEGDIPQAPPER